MPDCFEDFYMKNDDNWLAYTPEPLKILRHLYPDYFYAEEKERVNYPAVKQALSLQKSSARNLFLSLFSMPHVTSSSAILTDALCQIEGRFGEQIIAHGVEESKGGMRSLLMMALINQVQSPKQYFGALISGTPDITALSHGPYYLIYSLPSKKKTTSPNYPAFTDIAKVLVPFDENKTMLAAKLDEMHALKLISKEAYSEFINKLVTYDELLLELVAHAESLPLSTSKKRKSLDLKSASEHTELSLFNPTNHTNNISDSSSHSNHALEGGFSN